MPLQTSGQTSSPITASTLTPQYVDNTQCDETAPAFVSVSCPPIANTGPTLFGRLPGNKGAPDSIPIGAGLTFANGTLSAVSQLIGPPGPPGPSGTPGIPGTGVTPTVAHFEEWVAPTNGAQTVSVTNAASAIGFVTINGLAQPANSFSFVKPVITYPANLTIMAGDVIGAYVIYA